MNEVTLDIDFSSKDNWNYFNGDLGFELHEDHLCSYVNPETREVPTPAMDEVMGMWDLLEGIIYHNSNPLNDWSPEFQ